MLAESLTYGHTSLRTHLLTIANLAVQEFFSTSMLIKEEEQILAQQNHQIPFPPERKGLSPDRKVKGFEGENSSLTQGK